MVVLCEEQIVGYANFYEADYGDHCSIGNLIVHPQYRNQGVATYLIGKMERLAKDKYAAKESHLSCFEVNQKGLVLYQKLGYVSYALETREKGNGDCALLIEMKKLL